MSIFETVSRPVGRALGAVVASLGPRKNPGPGSDFWYEPIGANGSPVRVTADIALKASAVLACVKVLAETIATLPKRVYYEDAAGRHVATGHPLEEVIRWQPNRRQTSVEFWETIILWAALDGEGVAEIISDRSGNIAELEPIVDTSIRREMMRDRTLRYEFHDRFQDRKRRLLQDEMFRIPGMSRNAATGLGAVDLAADAIGLGIAADNYASRVFDNKLNMGGFLVHPGKLSIEAQKNMIASLTKYYAGGQNVGRPMLLQEGMDFKQASMDASEAQLLEARKWQISEIARYWRIPLHMLGIDDQTNRSTVEEQSLNFVKYTLRPWVKRIEQAIRRDLIFVPGKYFVKFNLDGLQRGDQKTRAEYYAKALGSGGHAPWMTPEEVRVTEGMNAVPEVGQFVMPTNGPASAPTSRADAEPSIEQVAERMIAREHTAIRKALMRHAADFDAFREWAKAFYGSQVASVMDALDIPKAAARAYCAFSRDQLLTANDTETYLASREDTAPAEIAGQISQWKEAS
jgi:HK97 family phage portal protein